MTEQKRGLSGSSSSGAGTKGKKSPGVENRVSAKFWVSHRMGPFQFHAVGGDCESQPSDNVGYANDAEAIIDQGFAPCPKCL